MKFIELTGPKLCNQRVTVMLCNPENCLRSCGFGNKVVPAVGLLRLPFQEDLIGWLSLSLPSLKKKKNLLERHPICLQ